LGWHWRAGQKRVVEFGEWLCQEVVKAVPHRHVVLSIPKILRRYFLIVFIEDPDVMKKILKHLGLNPLFPADFSQLPG
jgi:hypothetical protein